MGLGQPPQLNPREPPFISERAVVFAEDSCLGIVPPEISALEMDEADLCFGVPSYTTTGFTRNSRGRKNISLILMVTISE